MAGVTGGGVNATTLAAMIGVTKSRISQLVADGRLEGAYSGYGRDRRFDPVKAAQLLDVKLDAGQALGNGASAASARRDLISGERPADRRPTANAAPPSAEEADTARYQRARTEQAEIETMLKRRRLAEEDGRWVLASEVERATRAALAAEIAQVESMLRDGARQAADELGVDYRALKAILLEQWRRHRARRRDELAEQAGDAELTADELAEDIARGPAD